MLFPELIALVAVGFVTGWAACLSDKWTAPLVAVIAFVGLSLGAAGAMARMEKVASAAQEHAFKAGLQAGQRQRGQGIPILPFPGEHP